MQELKESIAKKKRKKMVTLILKSFIEYSTLISSGYLFSKHEIFFFARQE